MASSKRERELARRRVERQAARRAAAEAARKRRRALLLKLVAGAAAVAALAAFVVLRQDGDKDQSAAPAAPGECRYPPAEKAAKPVQGTPPTTDVPRTGTQRATLTTNRGTIGLTLLTSKAPCTVNSFAFLAKQKFFDGTACHRVTQGSLAVLQCGDPSGTGSGGPGYQFAEENLEGATYPKGTVAMARTATPGTNGSQFFLVYADSQLPPEYTPFGTITSGLNVVAAVGKAGPVGGDANPKPKLPITLTKVTVT